MRRFWKSVQLHTEPSSHYEVRLDGRSLRTPGGSLLKVPAENSLLATLVTHEWNEQSKVIKSHALPMVGSLNRVARSPQMLHQGSSPVHLLLTLFLPFSLSLHRQTSLIARSIDAFSSGPSRSQSISEMLKYAHTDTLCFHESDPKALVRLQAEHWDPLLDWIAEKFGHRPVVAMDTLAANQPEELIASLRQHLETLSPIQLAALEKALHLTKSLYLSLALLEGQISVEQAMHAAWVETNAQIETWGEVEDSHDVGWAELGRELGAVRLATVSQQVAGATPASKL